MFKYSNQKGSALVTTTAISAVILGLMALVLTREEQGKKKIEINKMQVQRDEVGRTILSYLSNPNILKASSASNASLDDCLNNRTCLSDTTDYSSAVKGSNGYYSFDRLTLAAPDGFSYSGDLSEEKKSENQAEEKNCFTSGHASCSLSGENVGYNLAGETGALSACFPLEAVVYMNPDCGTDAFGDKKASCVNPENLQFAYELIHHTDFIEECTLGNIPTRSLGTSPKKLSFISLPRHTLVENTCNVGAFIKGYDDSGNIECECRFPYTQIPGQSNSQGVKCQNISETCPSGTRVSGREDDGSPICSSLGEVENIGGQQKITISTRSAAGGNAYTPGDSIACANGGWVEDLKFTCSGSPKTEKNESNERMCSLFYYTSKLFQGGISFDGTPPFIHSNTSGPCQASENDYVLSLYKWQNFWGIFEWVRKKVGSSEWCHGGWKNPHCHWKDIFKDFWEAVKHFISVHIGKSTEDRDSKYYTDLEVACEVAMSVVSVGMLAQPLWVLPMTKLNTKCYPMEENPQISCDIEASCYNYKVP